MIDFIRDGGYGSPMNDKPPTPDLSKGTPPESMIGAPIPDVSKPVTETQQKPQEQKKPFTIRVKAKFPHRQKMAPKRTKSKKRWQPSPNDPRNVKFY